MGVRIEGEINHNSSTFTDIWFTYEEKKLVDHLFGEKVVLDYRKFPLLLIPTSNNLEITVRSPRDLIIPHLKNNDYLAEVIFTQENLHGYSGGIYKFKTRYLFKLDKALPLTEIERIPERVRKLYIKKVPKETHKLADELVGKRNTDTAEIIEKFHDFVSNHIVPGKKVGKSIKVLLKEFKKQAYFSGNCRDAATIFAALCNCKGLPVRKVGGINIYQNEGHAWNEVCVPVENTIFSYAWIPVDCTFKKSLQPSPDSYLLALLPQLKPLKLWRRFKNWLNGVEESGNVEIYINIYDWITD